MNIKQVDAGSAMTWLSEGWRLFKLNPGMWIALIIVYLVVMIVLGIIPILGGLALALITPALMTGMMHAARELDQGRDISIETLFAPLTDARKRGPMLTLGALYIAVGVVLVILIFIMGGSALIGGALMGGHAGAGMAAAGGMGLSMIIGLVAGFLIGMAFVYAGPLVMFQDVAPVEAIKGSFSACLQNIVPFIVYGIIAVILTFIAALPMFLGLLVVGPLLCAATYASYKAILE